MVNGKVGHLIHRKVHMFWIVNSHVLIYKWNFLRIQKYLYILHLFVIELNRLKYSIKYTMFILIIYYKFILIYYVKIELHYLENVILCSTYYLNIHQVSVILT